MGRKTFQNISRHHLLVVHLRITLVWCYLPLEVLLSDVGPTRVFAPLPTSSFIKLRSGHTEAYSPRLQIQMAVLARPLQTATKGGVETHG